MIITDDMTPIRGMLRRRKLRIDGEFQGELRRLADDPSTRKSFFSERGMRVDEAGEAMFDGGWLERRPSPSEVLDLLETILPPSDAKRQLRGVPVRIAELMADGKKRTAAQIRSGVHVAHGSCLCRDIRRLRGKTYGRIEMPVTKERGRFYYQFTAADIVKAGDFIPPPEQWSEGE